MGGAASLLCCACQALSCSFSIISCCFSGVPPEEGGISVENAKYFNLIFLGLATAFALSLRYSSDSWEIEWEWWTLSCSNVTNVYCQGDAATYRISFVLSLFFLFQIPFSCCGTMVHRGFWGIKILLFLVGIVGSLFIPNSVFNDHGYAWAARFVSAFYLIFQVILLIGFAYDWNDQWVARADRNIGTIAETGWLGAVLLCSAVIYAFAIAGMVFMYQDYRSCALGKSISTWSFLAAILMTLLSVFRERFGDEPGALLPAAVVSGYIVFLGYDSLESDIRDACNFDHSDGNIANLVINFLITTVALCWAADKERKSIWTVFKGEPSVDEYVDDEGVQAAIEKEQTEREERHLWCFHLVMAAVSMFMSMIVTNWGKQQSMALDASAPARSSTLIKLIAQLTVIALYMWTLVAPRYMRGHKSGQPPYSYKASGKPQTQVVSSPTSSLA